MEPRGRAQPRPVRKGGRVVSQTFNAQKDIAKGQPVKPTGTYTTTAMRCVVPCADTDQDMIGRALDTVACGENISVEVAEKKADTKASEEA